MRIPKLPPAGADEERWGDEGAMQGATEDVAAVGGGGDEDWWGEPPAAEDEEYRRKAMRADATLDQIWVDGETTTATAADFSAGSAGQRAGAQEPSVPPPKRRSTAVAVDHSDGEADASNAASETVPMFMAQGSELSSTDMPRVMTSEMSFETAFRFYGLAVVNAPQPLLQPRPEHLALGEPPAAGVSGLYGRVFAEPAGARRRRQWADRWEGKGGPRDCVVSGHDTTLGGQGMDVRMRRSCGAVMLRQPRTSAVGAPLECPTAGQWLNYHEYRLVRVKHVATCPGDVSGGCRCPISNEPGSARLFHLRVPGSTKGGRRRQPRQRSVRLRAGDGARDLQEGQRRLANGSGPEHAVPAPLTVRRQGASQKDWLAFEDPDGTEQGSITMGERGVTLTSSSGDFAEYFRRAADEVPFEEGDLVGINTDGELTRRTHGMPQVAIISRRAIVAGSAPDSRAGHDRAEYDCVAYTGQVPVKLRGSCQLGDDIVPSGLQDGTAKALPRQCWRFHRRMPLIGLALEASTSASTRSRSSSAMSQTAQTESVENLNFGWLERLLDAYNARHLAAQPLLALHGSPQQELEMRLLQPAGEENCQHAASTTRAPTEQWRMVMVSVAPPVMGTYKDSVGWPGTTCLCLLALAVLLLVAGVGLEEFLPVSTGDTSALLSPLHHFSPLYLALRVCLLVSICSYSGCSTR